MGFDFLEQARRMIGTNSISARGTVAIAEHVAGLMAPMALDVRMQEMPHRGVSQVNVIATKGPTTRDDLLLNTHLDTVPPGDHAAWTACGGNPFRATVDGDRIYGLGSADTKLDFLCKLKALEAFDTTPFRHGCALVGTFGEEVGLLGARALVDGGFFNFAHALVGEPSNLKPVFAHKGLAVWEIGADLSRGNPIPEERADLMELVFTGESAHGSTPGLGRNAVTAALDFLASTRRLPQSARVFGLSGGTASNMVPERCVLILGRDPRVEVEARAAGAHVESMGARPGRPIPCVDFLADILEGLRDLENRFGQEKDDAFNPSATTLNVGVLESREGSVKLVFEFRPVPSVVLDELSDGVSHLDEWLSARHPDLAIRVDNLRYNPPMRDARGGVLLDAALETLAAMGEPAEGTTKPTCTEAAVYSQLGIDTIVFGPGISEGNVHRPNEQNSLRQCEKAIAFYTRMIERFCVR
jgi:succinyl-diaminopimelate desuccinylase